MEHFEPLELQHFEAAVKHFEPPALTAFRPLAVKHSEPLAGKWQRACSERSKGYLLESSSMFRCKSVGKQRKPFHFVSMPRVFEILNSRTMHHATFQYFYDYFRLSVA